MNAVTVVRGKKDLVALYVDNELVATHDKFTKNNGDLERQLSKYDKVTEQKGEFTSFNQIPKRLVK